MVRAFNFISKNFKLDKVRSIKYNLGNKKLQWLKFIGAKTAEERTEAAKGDELLMELDKNLEMYVNDLETQEIFGKWAEKIAEDKGIEQGLEKGIEQGIEQGSLQEKKSIAKQMLKDSLPLKSIAKYTGLSLKEINSLQ